MKKILIVFSGANFAYSPSTLNLFYALRDRGHKVTLLTDEPSPNFSIQKINDASIVYLDTRVKRRIFRSLKNRWVDFFCNDQQREKNALSIPKALSYIEAIACYDPEIIIAVDFFCLWCVRQLNRSAHLLSLEIIDNDPYYKHCDFSMIESVIIQSKERFDYLFKNQINLHVHILPNSPNFDDFEPNFKARDKYNLIFCGSALPEFGIFSCLDFLNDYPEYRLTIKGAVPEGTKISISKFYNNLISEDRLIINETYMSTDELNRFVSAFRIGFAFYDFYRFYFLRSFNYYTAPSGKLYQYFNAGLPVIGNQLLGLSMVESREAGCLVPCLSSLEIKKALEKIEESYVHIAANSKSLSKDFDQKKYMEKVLDYIGT